MRAHCIAWHDRLFGHVPAVAGFFGCSQHSARLPSPSPGLCQCHSAGLWGTAPGGMSLQDLRSSGGEPCTFPWDGCCSVMSVLSTAAWGPLRRFIGCTLTGMQLQDLIFPVQCMLFFLTLDKSLSVLVSQAHSRAAECS